MVDAGGAVAVARSLVTGKAVGSGLCAVPREGVTELAAVGVLSTYRHRGIAAAIIGHLATTAFANRVRLIWLTAEHNEELRAAERAGFRLTGDRMIHISQWLKQ